MPSGPGYFDALGFWHYGEDDFADEGDGFSGVLNKAADALPNATEALVVEKIAADGTVVAATAAAVDAEVADRNLVEAVEAFPPEAAGGFIGENDRATDLLVDEDGNVIPATIERWAPRIGAAGGFVDGVVEAPFYGGGLAGENGRATDILLDDEGHIVQDVLDYWASRMQIAAPSEVAAVVLPSTLHLIVGQTYRLEWAKIIRAWDRSWDVIVTGLAGGSGNYGEYWQYTPTAATSFTLTVTVKDRTGATVITATRPVIVRAVPSGATTRHLALGDSITRNGGYVRNGVTDALGGQTVGIRTYDGGLLNIEGRGGWSLNAYMTRIGHATAGDSPFLFPVGVTAAKYRGNTAFWRSVTTTDPSGYDFDGFQKIARGWGTPATPYLFDSNGYPVSPAEGDVVVDPTQAAGARWRIYTGGSWTTMSPQPAVEFSFTKYMSRYAAAFPNGAPTAVSIMLATNDFFSVLDDGSWNTYRANLDAVIASVRAWDADIPVVLIAAPSPGPANLWAAETVNRPDFQRRMVEYAARLYSTYDTPTARANGLHVTGFLGVTSDANMTDWVHPAAGGHAQMGPWLAGVLAYLITEGDI